MAKIALRDAYADVNGVRLHYVSAGHGPLLMFLHGFPEFWYAWKDQLAAFAPDHLAVAPDLRGYNLSAKPEGVEQYRLALLVEDVRALADHLGAERFVLVGHDWGGVVAWRFAAAYPDRLSSLVVINGPHPAVFARELRENPAQRRASAYMLLFRSAEAEARLAADDYRWLVDAVLAPGLRDGSFTEADRAAYLRAWSQPGALTGGLNYYRAAALGPDAADRPPPSDDAAERITAPTLVIWGEQDHALLTGCLDGLGAYVENLTVRRVPDGTHWVVHEQPALINATIRGFLEEQETANAP